jgi:hypothetical protein
MPRSQQPRTIDDVLSLDAVAHWYGRGAITIEEAARLLDSARSSVVLLQEAIGRQDAGVEASRASTPVS